VKAKEVLSVIN